MDMTIDGLVLLLVGLGLIWLGIHMARPGRDEAYEPETRRLRRQSRTERWLRCVGSTLMGLGFASLGLIVLHYPANPASSISARAPLIDHVAWAVVLVGLIGGTIIYGVGQEVSRAAENKWVQRELAEDL